MAATDNHPFGPFAIASACGPTSIISLADQPSLQCSKDCNHLCHTPVHHKAHNLSRDPKAQTASQTMQGPDEEVTRDKGQRIRKRHVACRLGGDMRDFSTVSDTSIAARAAHQTTSIRKFVAETGLVTRKLISASSFQCTQVPHGVTRNTQGDKVLGYLEHKAAMKVTKSF